MLVVKLTERYEVDEVNEVTKRETAAAMPVASAFPFSVVPPPQAASLAEWEEYDGGLLREDAEAATMAWNRGERKRIAV